MNVAVIGVGRMGQLHARLLANANAVTRLVVADADIDRAKVIAEGLGADVAPDPIHAVASADAAVIATPVETHAALVRAAVERGCPVLCEKPLAESVAAAIDLADFVDRSGVLVRVGFQRRFDDGYRAARAARLEGRLGRLHLMWLQTTEPGRPPSPRTNLFRNTAIHDFDLVRWLSGQEVLSVYVDGADRERQVFDPRFDPDTITASLRLTGGALAALTVTRLSPDGYQVRAELVGSRDHVAVRSRSERCSSWETRFEDAYRNELAGFLEAVSGGADAGATVRDAVEAQRIAEAARASLEQGSPIMLET
ncbi:MAG TPA: Gfo/Idh/MocA family oxidoreductase [Candidatus Dormibacteraeota bacterium]|nr:Gfo/Idh/MocA family oxidoreductase [Candidatus Dormibacteraeota bacterium]